MKHLLIAIIACLALVLVIGSDVVEASDCGLIKSESHSAVYYQCDGKRYAFPTEGVFFSWYQDFEFVQNVTDKAIANARFAGNVTYRPGVRLVKIQTDPKVYVVDGKKLRWVTSESLAKELYGNDWAQKVDDISDAYFVNYVIGESIYSKADYDPLEAQVSYTRVSDILNIQLEDESFCGNGMIDDGEECDGGWYCDQFCKIEPALAKVSYNPIGSIEDIYAEVGDKVLVDGGLNLRIESVSELAHPTYGSRVGFSVWGKDQQFRCKLISTTGELWSNNGTKGYRAFVGGFFELVSVSGEKAHLRKYTGLQARSRCLKVAGDDAGLVCNYYPAGDSSYVESENFRVHFSSTENQNAAEYYARSLDNCFYAYFYSGLSSIISRIYPYTNSRKWDVFPTDTKEFNTDFERIMVPRSLMVSKKSLSQLQATEGRNCPIGDSNIAHELGHLLFATTPLQGMYDASSKAEIRGDGLGSVSLSEGLPTFLVSYLAEYVNDEQSKLYTGQRDGYCGKDRLINTDGKFDGASYNQLKYSEALAGRGVGQSDYYAGYCFFRRVEDSCIHGTNLNMLAQVIMSDGIIEERPTIFTLLAVRCGVDVIKSIMTDFGFSHELLEVMQKHPNNGFASGLDELGCK